MALGLRDNPPAAQLILPYTKRMILKGSQRGNGDELALHLLKTEDNEHVEIYDIRHLSASTLQEAFTEMESVSNGTRCRQYLFSVSINPPQKETAPIEYFEEAIEAIEQKLKLTGQPRVIVFHEKEGRRHAHCVWSRIDTQEIKAINLPHFKQKLNDVSKELFLKYEWELPKGYIDRHFSNPYKFTLQEWQQAKRAGENPQMLKAMFRGAWERSDNAQSFKQALQDYGFTLARGDRRGFVAVDYKGEVYSLTRWTRCKSKELQERLGEPKNLPSVNQAKQDISKAMTGVLEKYIQDVRQETNKKFQPLKNAAITMREQHKIARTKLENTQEKRWAQEETQRMARVPKGIKSLWSRFTGAYRKIRQENEHETNACSLRDRNEKQALVERQLQERQKLQDKIQTLREERNQTTLQMRQDIGCYMEKRGKKPDAMPEFTVKEQREYSHVHSQI